MNMGSVYLAFVGSGNTLLLERPHNLLLQHPHILYLRDLRQWLLASPRNGTSLPQTPIYPEETYQKIFHDFRPNPCIPFPLLISLKMPFTTGKVY